MKNIKSEIKDDELSKENNALTIIKGSMISIMFTLVILTIYAAVLSFTSVSESTMIPVIIVVTGISILIGSSISTMHIKNKGLVNGGLVGLIYMLFIYIVSSIVVMNFEINFNSIIMIIVAILTGMIGGVIGVNIK